jgi:hypothetical protein
MTQLNENEAIGTNEPCIEVARNDRLSADITVSGKGPVTLVWVGGEGAGMVCLTYHDNKLVDVVVHNCTVAKRTHKDSAGNHTVVLRVKGDY